MTKRFTANTPLWRIRHCRQFRDFRRYVICPRGLGAMMQVYKIKNLSWFYPVNADSLAHAFNRMREAVDEGKLKYYPFLKKDVGIYAFLIGENRPFVLVLPGGGYGDVCSPIEGYAVAVRLNELGYNAFIGNYRVGKDAHYPNPHDDVAEMLRFIESKKEEWNVSTDDYAVCGFSAGGHLAASWCTKAVGYEKYHVRKPAAVFLAYPVITMGEYTHEGSRKKLLSGDSGDPDLQKRYSAELQVDGDYPKTFLWQCKNDPVVPFKNSQIMAEALKRNGVKHIFMPVEGDKHGWGLGAKTTAEGWIEKAVALWQESQLKIYDKNNG